jgi:hypothetical protein
MRVLVEGLCGTTCSGRSETPKFQFSILPFFIKISIEACGAIDSLVVTVGTAVEFGVAVALGICQILQAV